MSTECCKETNTICKEKIEDTKWDFAYEEAVKQLEDEHRKKTTNKTTPKNSPSFLRRLTNKIKKSKDSKDPQQLQQQQQQKQKGEQEDKTEYIDIKDGHHDEKNQEKEVKKIELKNSTKSPIMSGSSTRTGGHPHVRNQRKKGVAERNETERHVVYRTLKNYNQINKLRDYDLM